MLAFDFPLLGLMLSGAGVFIGLIWLGLLLWVMRDIFRDTTLTGRQKAVWLFIVVVAPFLGVAVYAFVRTDIMGSPAHQARIDDERASIDHLQLRG